jgi:hypothetical protein
LQEDRENANIDAGLGFIWRISVYELADVEEARTDSDKIKPLIAHLGRVWGNRVSRRREILEIVQEIVS